MAKSFSDGRMLMMDKVMDDKEGKVNSGTREEDERWPVLKGALMPDETRLKMMFTCFQTSPYFYGSLAIYYILKGPIASHLFLSPFVLSPSQR